jgi:hypothetical protein
MTRNVQPAPGSFIEFYIDSNRPNTDDTTTWEISVSTPRISTCLLILFALFHSVIYFPYPPFIIIIIIIFGFFFLVFFWFVLVLLCIALLLLFLFYFILLFLFISSTRRHERKCASPSLNSINVLNTDENHRAKFLFLLVIFILFI